MGVDYKVLGEFGVNDTVLALDPARSCSASCLFCHVELSRRAAKWGGKSRRLDAPDTFARYVNRAFGPDHDPTDFREFALRNRLPVTWSSGVEPWQDVSAALAVFDIIDRLDLPVFLQTRATNWRDVWDAFRSRAGQVALYVSMPSDDPACIKRYEPGTPVADERWALIEAAAEAGIPTMLAVAPYHPDWCRDLAALVRKAIGLGVEAVFFDPLNLSPKQIAASSDPTLAGLVATAWGPRTVAEATAAKAECTASGVAWQAVSWMAPIHRLESAGDMGWPPYRDAMPYGYRDDRLYSRLHELTDDDDAGPVLATWGDALAAMEAGGKIDQPFSWASLGHELMVLKNLPPAWIDRLKPTATIAECLRALWDDPKPSGFAWRHPFARLAVRPDGEPWLSESGDALMIFNPNYAPTALRRVVEDPGAIRRMSAVGV